MMATGFVERDKGKSVIATQYQSAGGQFYASSQDGITALGNSQGTAFQLNNSINRITTAAASTGVLLPKAIPGANITVINAGASTLTIYGMGSDTINGGASVTLATTKVATFYSTLAGVWHMLLSA
jgi:hypothetical protein